MVDIIFNSIFYENEEDFMDFIIDEIFKEDIEDQKDINDYNIKIK